MSLIDRSISNTPQPGSLLAAKRGSHARARDLTQVLSSTLGLSLGGVAFTFRLGPATQPAWLTSTVLSQQIPPLFANIPTSAIESRLGVSRWYAVQIRRGYRPASQALAGVGRFGWRY